VVDVCKHLEVAGQTCYRWRNQYGGMKADDANRLKVLDNAMLGGLTGETSELLT
jgi:transposase-like protein